MADSDSSETLEQPSSSAHDPVKDPRLIARNYQLMLCKKAVEENIIVYLGTGCGKTHIAVLLIYELRHLIIKPQKNVCVFLAPTVHLVRQQAMVIEDSANFKVGSYFGNSKRLKNHHDWEKEIEQHEVLVMTPQILLRNLEHCFIRMEIIALLIFDECHHAQIQNRHPYAQIMKEFYKTNNTKRPRIFGMTASPVIGKGGNCRDMAASATAELCDANTTLLASGELRVLQPIFNIYGQCRVFSGPIVTVKVFEDNVLVRELLETRGDGRVLVIDGGGSMRCALVGGNLGQLAQNMRWAGILVNGCIRDVDEINGCDIGVRALASHPLKSNKKGIGEKHVSVHIGGDWIHDGEWLYADSDGILISKRELSV